MTTLAAWLRESLATITAFEASYAATLAASTVAAVPILIALAVNSAALSKAPAAPKQELAAEASALATADANL